MKVLEINVVCGIRSTGRICTDLADILHKEGHQCMIAYGREEVPEKYQKYAIRIGNDRETAYHFLMSRLFDRCGFESKNATKELIRKIKDYNPDIIHLHNLHGYYINIEILFEYLKTSGKKIIWTLHDCWPYTGHCSYYSAVNCEQWKKQCLTCPQTKEYPACILRGNVKSNFVRKKNIFTGVPNMTLVTPSKWLAGQVRSSFLSEYPVAVIPNGIDLEQFRPIESDFRKQYHLEDKIIVLGVATAWGERKGYREFCRLAENLPNEYQIVLVGLTKKQLKTVPPNILGIERTNSVPELAGIYSAANIFANLGREETMGLTTVEAMACGTPVVVSNMSAIPEVVGKDSGIVLNSLAENEIICAIKTAAKGEYSGMLQNASKYEKEKQYQKYIELYESKKIFAENLFN